jgi:hypothetical protein
MFIMFQTTILPKILHPGGIRTQGLLIFKNMQTVWYKFTVQCWFPKQLFPNDISLNYVSPNDVSPNDVSPNDVSPNDVSPNDVSPNDVSPKTLLTTSR